MGAKFPPQPLRSTFSPEASHLSLTTCRRKKRRKVDADAAMADMAARHCIQSHGEGKRFSLEHPKNSIARELDSWKELEALEGVFVTPYHSCTFATSERRKSQVLIHNIEGMDEAMGKLCRCEMSCSRTGKPHKNWKPKVVGGKVVSFATGEEREYPTGFCNAYACGLTPLLQDPGFRFLEIFSGPNAPLSQAAASLVPPCSESLAPEGGDVIEYSHLPSGKVVPRDRVTWMRSSNGNPIGRMQSPVERNSAMGNGSR